MKQTKLLMGMPITIEISDKKASKQDFEKVYDYFKSVEDRFSPFKETSEVFRINMGLIGESQYSRQMLEVLALAQTTKKETNGYFDIKASGKFNPSGLVKGWAIFNAAKILQKDGFKNFFIEAGGDIEAHGARLWRFGIRNPFKTEEIVKVVGLKNCAIATSGTYFRGAHIYNPFTRAKVSGEIVSLSVIGENIYETDRFATGAFAMGLEGINFVEKLEGFEGYLIDKSGMATETSGFNKYVIDSEKLKVKSEKR